MTKTETVTTTPAAGTKLIEAETGNMMLIAEGGSATWTEAERGISYELPARIVATNLRIQEWSLAD